MASNCLKKKKTSMKKVNQVTAESEKNETRPGELNKMFDEHSNGKLLKIMGTIQGHPMKIMIDSGASRNFIGSKTVDKYHLPNRKQHEETMVVMVDGHVRPCVFYIPDAKLKIAKYTDSLVLFITQLKKYNILLGKTWLEKWNPRIDWRTNEVTFWQKDHSISFIANGFKKTFTLKVEAVSIQINQVSVEELMNELPNGEVFLIFANEVQTIKAREEKFAIELEDILKEFQDVFPKDLPPGLPPSRTVDHKIDIMPGAEPPSKPTYRLLQPELEELKKQLEDFTEKGFIQPSKSPYGAPVIFLKKKDGTFKMCMDYQAF